MVWVQTQVQADTCSGSDGHLKRQYSVAGKGAVVIDSSLTSEVGGSNQKKMVVSYRWSAVYSTDP